MEEVYRSCASCVVLRPSSVCSPDGCGSVFDVLLLHKPRKNDDWQLPQGGVEEGESLEQAGLRELGEEAGLSGTIFGRSDTAYRYDFPESYRRFRPDNVKGQSVQFVFVRLADGQSVQVDEEEIDNYTWVLPEQIEQYITRPEYLAHVHRVVQEAIDHYPAE